MIDEIKNFFRRLPIIGTPFNASEVTTKEELENGLTLKKYKGDSAMEKMGEIDLEDMEIRLVDEDWLHNRLLAHELAHYERYKKGYWFNKISGHFGDFVIYGTLTAGFFYFFSKLTSFSMGWTGWFTLVGLPFFIFPIICKGIEEEEAEKMVPDMKEKYNLGVKD